ncbi:hypothetical protein [Actinoplanes sp. NPDC049802]|uniref:hypothetical protein n=1 Tax=Actinoplanes sp. NPDC049802 TaxID=3154742 RepID=UPI0033F81CB1
MTHQKPGTVDTAEVDEGPNNLLLGITVAVLALAVTLFGGLAVLNPISLISLAPEWFAEPGTAQILAATALTMLIAGLLYTAVRAANRGYEQAAIWITLAALLVVPMFSVV